MKVLVIGGVAEHLGKKSEVKHIEVCEGIGALYQLKDFPTELGLALYFSEDQLVFLDGPVKVSAKIPEPKRV